MGSDALAAMVDAAKGRYGTAARQDQQSSKPPSYSVATSTGQTTNAPQVHANVTSNISSDATAQGAQGTQGTQAGGSTGAGGADASECASVEGRAGDGRVMEGWLLKRSGYMVTR